MYPPVGGSPAAQLGDRDLATQAVEDDADLLFGGILLAGGPPDVSDETLGRCLWRAGFLSHGSTPQVVTMSPKSSVPQAASLVSQVLMSDTAPIKSRLTLNPDDPEPPLAHAANCLKAFDDGHEGQAALRTSPARGVAFVAGGQSEICR